jgi:hypothetical protein
MYKLYNIQLQEENSMFLRNIGNYLQIKTAPNPKQYHHTLETLVTIR